MAGQPLTQKVKTVSSHREIRLHLVVQPLGPIPHIPATTPAVYGDAILQLFDALPVELNGQLFVT